MVCAAAQPPSSFFLHPLLNRNFFPSYSLHLLILYSYLIELLGHPHPLQPYPPCVPLSLSLFVVIKAAKANLPPRWPFVTSFTDSETKMLGWDCLYALKHTHVHAESLRAGGVEGGVLG